MENYNYPIKHFLLKDLNLIPSVNAYIDIKLCFYSLNTN